MKNPKKYSKNILYSFKTEHTNLSNSDILTDHFFQNLLQFFHLPSRISPRPISDIQLNALLHLHPCPIYLVVFKGSYSFRMRDISS